MTDLREAGGGGAEPLDRPGRRDADAHGEAPGSIADLLGDEHSQGPRAGRAVRFAALLVPLLFGLAALVQSLRLGVGDPRDPGPGLWPVLTSGAVILCAVCSC